jgi:hypothetical protein
MNGKRFFLAVTLVTSLALLPSAIAGERISNKAAGRTSTTVVNTILSGSGAPAKTLGINGDFYIDTKNLNLYGPKASGVWKVSTSLRSRDVPVVSNIIGETGAMGQTGPKGATGDKGATGAIGPQGIPGLQGIIGITGTTGLTGAIGATGLQGLQGLMGVIGATGLTGTAGTNGLTGVAGAKGDTGSQGIPGAKGDAGSTGAKGETGSQGIPGAKGDAGSTGAKGDTGSQGIPGAKGDAGAPGAKGDAGTTGTKGDAGTTGTKGDAGTTGAKGDAGSTGAKGDAGASGAQGDAGISVSKFVTVPSAILAITTAGNSTSHTFFTAESAGNYTFQVIVAGAASSTDTFRLNAEIVLGNFAITNQFAVVSYANSFANGISGRIYGFTIIGAVSDVSAEAIFSIRITNETTVGGGTPIAFSGKALVNKVGSIG